MNGGSVNVTPSEYTDTIKSGTLTTSSASYGGIDFPYVNQTYLCQGAASYNFNTPTKTLESAFCPAGKALFVLKVTVLLDETVLCCCT